MIYRSGFGLEKSKILLSGSGFGPPEYPIFRADLEQISDRIRISDNNSRPIRYYVISFKLF